MANYIDNTSLSQILTYLKKYIDDIANTKQNNLNRTIWGAHDTGGDISGNMFVGDSKKVNNYLEYANGAINLQGNIFITGGNAATKDYVNNQVNWKIVTDATDLNTMTTTGKYLMEGTLTNTPTSPWAYLIVENAAIGRITQTIWHDTDATNQYTRQLYNAVWGGWVKIANSGDIPTKLSQLTNDIHANIDGVSYGTLKIYPSAQITVAGSDDGAITPKGVNKYVSANYLSLSGGTLTGVIKSNFASNTWINGVTNACLTGNYTGYGAIFNAPVKGGRISLSTYPVNDNFLYFGFATTAQITAGTNSFNSQIVFDMTNSAITATTFKGILSGNADTATKLATARTIWGQNFDGSADINGNIIFPAITTGSASGITWSGSTDGASIYYRLDAADVGRLVLNLSDDSNTLISFALNGTDFANINTNGVFSGTAVNATKLQTTRSIWGQSFDGSGNVDGTLNIRSGNGTYTEGIRLHKSPAGWSTIILCGADNTGDTGTSPNSWSIHNTSANNFAISHNSSDGANGLLINQSGNVGIGTTTPAYKLDVNGNGHFAGPVDVGGVLQLSNSGLKFADNAFGGGGDTAKMYLTTKGGEATTMTFEVENDGDDTINFITPSSTGLTHNNNIILDTGNYSNYALPLHGTADTAAVASRLGKNGTSGAPMAFNWSGQSGQPSWLWGGNDGTNMYVYNPLYFRVNYANSAGNSDKLEGFGEAYFLRERGNWADGANARAGLSATQWISRVNYQTDYGDSLHIQGTSTWYNRLDFGTNGRIYFYQAINPSTLTGCMQYKGALAYLTDTVAASTKVIASIHANSSDDLVYANIGDNDCFRIHAGGAYNGGWGEIATADDGNEPIYVRQYTGAFANIARTLTLLDENGNTIIPGSLNVRGNMTVKGELSCNDDFSVDGYTTLGGVSITSGMNLSGGAVAGVGLKVGLYGGGSPSSPTLISKSDNVVLLRSAGSYQLPAMRAEDDGHMIMIKHIIFGNGAIDVMTNHSSVILYDNLIIDTHMPINNMMEAMTLIYCRQFTLKGYTGVWVQWKNPRDW